MVLGTPMWSEHTDVPRNGKISCCVITAKIKVLHQKPLILRPTRTFPGSYGIELLWWHYVTNGLEEPHGVRAYGCTKKWEHFLLCTGTTAKIKVLHQKPLVLMPTRTFPGTYGIDLLWWNSVTNCFGDPTGSKRMDISTNGNIFLWCSSATAKIEVLPQNLLIRMGTRIC